MTQEEEEAKAKAEEEARAKAEEEARAKEGEAKEPSELEKVSQMASSIGIDVPALVGEIQNNIVSALLPHIKDGIGNVETKLIPDMIAKERAEVLKDMSEAMPPLIEGQVKQGVQDALKQFEEKAREMAGAAGAGAVNGGMNIGAMLHDSTALESVLKIIETFKGKPAGADEIANQFGLIFKGMEMGLKLKQDPSIVKSMADEFKSLGGGGEATK